MGEGRRQSLNVPFLHYGLAARTQDRDFGFVGELRAGVRDQYVTVVVGEDHIGGEGRERARHRPDLVHLLHQVLAALARRLADENTALVIFVLNEHGLEDLIDLEDGELCEALRREYSEGLLIRDFEIAGVEAHDE